MCGKVFLHILILSVIFLVPVSAEDQPLVTVMDFELSGISEPEGRLLVDFISNSIRETGRYRIIDRAQRDSILEEQEFSLSGCTDEKCQLEVGKLLSANLMFVGSIGRIGDRYILNMKLIDVATGEAVGTVSDKYTNLNNLVDDSSRLVLGLLKAPEPEVPVTVEKPDPAESESGGALIPDSVFILYYPGRFLKSEYYMLNGVQYKLKYFQGYSSLIQDIMDTTPSRDGTFEEMLQDYLKDIKKFRTWEITGVGLGVVGYIGFMTAINSYPSRDLLGGVSLLAAVGGWALNLLGSLRMSAQPEDIVNHYNLHYAGR